MNWNLHLKLLLPCNFIRCLARPLSLLLLISFELQYKRDGNCIQTSRSMAVLCPCDFIIAFFRKKKHKIFLFHTICCRVCVGDVDHTQFLIENISISILVIWAFRFQQNFGRDFLYFIIDFPYSNIDSLQTNFDLSFRMNFFQHRLSFQINWRIKTTDSTKIYS